jgi:hypothetical protein
MAYSHRPLQLNIIKTKLKEMLSKFMVLTSAIKNGRFSSANNKLKL